MNVGFYTTIIRKNRGVRYLTGPFDLPPTQQMIDAARDRAIDYDQMTHFDYFGSARVESPNDLPQGIFNDPHDRPCASVGLSSYRYQGPFGWIMIGAASVADALKEAARSTDAPITPERLWRWSQASGRYVPGILPGI